MIALRDLRHTSFLGSFCSTIELHPRALQILRLLPCFAQGRILKIAPNADECGGTRPKHWRTDGAVRTPFVLAPGGACVLSLCAMTRVLFLLLMLAGCGGGPPITPVRMDGAAAPVGESAGRGWRAVDGDTIKDPAGRTIRVIGVDSPEMPGHAQCAAEDEAALAARDFTAAALAGAKRIELQEKGPDRYRRLLAIVLIDGRDLAAMLISAGHGRAYRGERRRGWCD